MKKFFYFFLVLLVLFSFSSNVFVYAEENNIINYKELYQKSRIEEDLKGYVSNGESFDINNYQVDYSKDFSLIAFLEVGYNCLDDGELYFYLYNPKLLNINSISVNLGCGLDNKYMPNNFNKFYLDYVGSSGAIYKFSLLNNCYCLVNNCRYYNLSEIEIYTDNNIDILEIGTQFIFSGNMPKTSEDVNTLSCVTSDYDVLYLDLKDTYYRFDFVGSYETSQINSVYFSIPNYFLKKYGDIYSIDAEWYEYRTNPIVVSNNRDFVDYIKNNNYFNTNISSSKYGFGARTGEIYTLFLKKYKLYQTFYYDFTFNLPYKQVNKGGGKGNDYYFDIDTSAIYPKLNGVNWVFYAQNANDENYYLSTKTLKNYIDTFSNGNMFAYAPNKFASELLFDKYVDDNRVLGYNNETITNSNFLLVDSPTLDYGDKEFVSYCNKIYKEKYPAIVIDEIIKKIERKDIDVNKKDLPNNLYISKNPADIESFYDFCDSSLKEDSTPYLFRFANTNYMSAPLDLFVDGILQKNPAGFICRETMFLGFDIIKVDFKSQAVGVSLPNVTSISVAQKPVDIISPFQPPPNYPEEDLSGFNWKKLVFWVVLILVSVVLSILLIYGFISNPILVVKILLFPITLIFYLCKGVSLLISKIKKE